MRVQLGGILFAATLSLGISAPADAQRIMSESEFMEMVLDNAYENSAESQYQLGVRHAIGDGTPLDYVRARKLFEEAAAQGNVDAQYSLGVIYLNGHGVPQSYVKSREFFEKAAKHKHADALFNLGFLYFHGKGVRQNKTTAKNYYGQSCDNGFQDGCNNYRGLNEQGY